MPVSGIEIWEGVVLAWMELPSVRWPLRNRDEE
jgi:hypothetical protein